MTREQQKLLAYIMTDANAQMSNLWNQDDPYWMEAHEAYSVCDWINEKISEIQERFSEVQDNEYGIWSVDEAEKIKSDYKAQIADLEELKTIMEGK